MKRQAVAEGTKAQETEAMASSSSSSIGTAAAAAVRPHISRVTTQQQQRPLAEVQLTPASSSLGTAGEETIAKVLAGGMVRRAAALGVMLVMAAVAAAAIPLQAAATAAAAIPLQAAAEAAKGQAVMVGIRAATEAAALAQPGAPGLAQGMGLGRVAADQADLAARLQVTAAVGEMLVGYNRANMLAASQHSTAPHTTVSDICFKSFSMFC
jgi:hypothetical protein